MLRKTRVVRLAVLCAGTVLAVAGCGEDDFENEPRPPVSISLTGVIQDRGVNISPNELGAGPAEITISNQTDEAYTVTLEGEDIEETIGPIQPADRGTIQQTLTPGIYEVRAGSPVARAQQIPAAELEISEPRKPSNDDLLLP